MKALPYMSEEKNIHEAKRWLATALDDFKAADILMKNRMFAHSCFLFQQAAEKALKALWYREDLDPWGHSALKLIEGLPKKYGPLKRLKSPAAFLDKFYIPTHYPNGLPELTPSQAYTHKESFLCRKETLKILKKIQDIIENG